jgi:hypothetical protein
MAAHLIWRSNYSGSRFFLLHSFTINLSGHVVSRAHDQALPTKLALSERPVLSGRPSGRRVVAVVEGRDGADGTRQRSGRRRLVERRINEGDGGSGEVRVLSCRGGVAPVTSLEYRGCWGGG